MSIARLTGSDIIMFISVAVSRLPETDTWCIIYPQLTSLLSGQISSIDSDSLNEAALPPVRINN